ncbi:PadR family transcriptional regulator [Demequina sp. SYSU T00068]|uniref:PadR family transcriptional regulator n=1 Tax=Demequina lignilytica TaxID=3051663 RepID=UPI00261A9056|nr:PadR family transcriptional regulator [Demequina sp. SYSU T00068]MDN4489589.1 PadR family transcriptional regulator [Demequina sp. SYSU T00068]
MKHQHEAWRAGDDEAWGRGRHGGFGPGDGGEGGRGRRGGSGGRGGHGGPGGRRGGRPRGDVRSAILLLLAEQPRHGYELIRAIEERSSGAWVPSPGSIYPTLQALEDEGLVGIETVEGRKTASLTAAGREWAAEHAAEMEALFSSPEGHESAAALRQELGALREAAVHVARQPGRPELAARAVEILAAARKDLYRLLVDDQG